MLAYILCIETANGVTSVALSREGVCVAKQEIQQQNKTADSFHLLTQALLEETGLGFSDLKAVAISAGPGSYTGLRIAVAAAKGYCFSLDIPLIAVPTLQAMAFGLRVRYGIVDTDIYVPMIDARRMEVYLSCYNDKLELSRHYSSYIIDENFDQLFDTPARYTLFGNGAEKSRKYTSCDQITFFDNFVPSAEDMCVLAYERFQSRHFEDVAYYEPDYAKPYYTTASKVKG